MAELDVELVAANGRIWEGQARQVSVRAVEGDIGILPGHQPLLTVLAPGEVRISGGGQERNVKVDWGFLSVDRDRVTIVAETVGSSGS